MVEINFDQSRPSALLDLSHLDELDSWANDEGAHTVRIGAGVSYTRIIDELSELCPALAIAARTVGSPQIRNKGTVGGNLATASPAGDSHPPLLACRATVEAESVRGTRLIPIDDFFVGPKVNSLEPDELIRAVRIPVADGPQQFAKIGPRNAMVIATASFALCLDIPRGRVGTGIGSAGPTPLRATAAEELIEPVLQNGSEASLDVDIRHEFGRLVAAAASPIDDVRGTAAYRGHALSVLARRCLDWTWADVNHGTAS